MQTKDNVELANRLRSALQMTDTSSVASTPSRLSPVFDPSGLDDNYQISPYSDAASGVSGVLVQKKRPKLNVTADDTDLPSAVMTQDVKGVEGANTKAADIGVKATDIVMDESGNWRPEFLAGRLGTPPPWEINT